MLALGQRQMDTEKERWDITRRAGRKLHMRVFSQNKIRQTTSDITILCFISGFFGVARFSTKNCMESPFFCEDWYFHIPPIEEDVGRLDVTMKGLWGSHR
jgi:hypothetical protein